MDLVIGGAYQGKLDYARNELHVQEADICDCASGEADFSRRCLYHYEQYLYHCVLKGMTPELPAREDAVVIADDISCGVVPMDPNVRAWRELCGRTLTALAARSTTVTRLFCGLSRRLKG
ncbi:MAG: bifunctional adenosylcobinamide kinase/adenosylcobinamide-phosphate guanylyltransferase [Oscillospiraceae bacterium]|nr:bifunctional adenosylcobinamide kinase/adenosylcobinamide-phosphate guanylyltransferase [Oscillospiraceae bacterium]